MPTIEMLDLPAAPEPVALKAQAVGWRRDNPTWDSDSLWAWYGNRLASYFWTQCLWSQILKQHDVTWLDFLKCLSAWKPDITRWLRSELSWEQLAADIHITAPRFRPWLQARHGHHVGYFPLRTV